MIENSTPSGPRAARRFILPLGIGAAGVIAGAVLAGTLSASAASPSPSASTGTSSTSTPSSEATETHGQRAETVVTNTATIAKIKAAVLAKYPGATFDKVETDSTGAYEAEITTAAGKAVHVNLSKALVVTGERGGGGRAGHGHSNTDAAHEAAESPARAAEEAAQDAQSTITG